MPARTYSNTAVDTTLVSGIDNVVTSLAVVSAAGWPASPFLAVIDPGTANEEIVLVGNKSGTTFSSLTRGFGGTPAVAHNASVPIKHVTSAEDHRLIWEHVHSGVGLDDTAVVSHNSLGTVTANQHHNQIHPLSSGDHTGQLDHGTGLSGLSDDDHPQYLKEEASGGTAAELPDHTHASGAQAGTIAHSVLTGLSNDEHTQYRLESADHSHQSAGLQGGKIDHGAALNGLSDNDHPQYLLFGNIESDSEVNFRTFTNTSYLDLDALTGGTGSITAVSVSVETGTRALVFISANIENDTVDAFVMVSCRVSGATTISATDDQALTLRIARSLQHLQATRVIMFPLNAGTNNFELQARVTSNTGGIKMIDLVVIPL